MIKTTDPTSYDFSTDIYKDWDKKISEQNENFKSNFETIVDIIHNVKISIKKDTILKRKSILSQCNLLSEKINPIVFDNSMSFSAYSFKKFCNYFVEYVRKIFLSDISDKETNNNEIKLASIYKILNSRQLQNVIFEIKENQPDPRIWSHKNWIKQLLGKRIIECDTIKGMFEPGSLKYFTFEFTLNVSRYSESDISKIFTNDFEHPEFSISNHEKKKIRNFLLNNEILNNVIYLVHSILKEDHKQYKKQKELLKILKFEYI